MKTGDLVKGCPFFFFLLISLLFSCAGPSPLKEFGTFPTIPNVPFYPQEAYQCGPAALAGVLNYWGVQVSPSDIAAEIFSAKAKGTLDIDMIFYAERKGLKAVQFKGNLDDLQRNIHSGNPLIVLVDYGFWVYEQNHFMVVVGYAKGGIIANSGKEKHKFIPLDNFWKTWERAKFWTLRVTPQ